MSKKSKLNLGTILCGVAALLGLVAVFMLFAPNVTTGEGKALVEYSGLETVFGAKHKVTTEVMGNTVTTETQVFNFSFLSFLPYLLALVGVVFAVLAALGKLGKIAPIVSAACFVVAAVLFFIAVPACVPHASEDLSAEDIKELKETAKMALGAGAIVAGVFSIVSALGVGATLVVKNK